MIYSVFLYHYQSGIILTDINFHELSNEEDENLSFLGSFISAINSFFSAIIVGGKEQNHRMKLLHIGDYCLKSYMLFPKLFIDLVVICGINDKFIDDQIKEIIQMLFDYYDLFENTNPNKSYEFRIVEMPIIQILRKWTYTEYFSTEAI